MFNLDSSFSYAGISTNFSNSFSLELPSGDGQSTLRILPSPIDLPNSMPLPLSMHQFTPSPGYPMFSPRTLFGVSPRPEQTNGFTPQQSEGIPPASPMSFSNRSISFSGSVTVNLNITEQNGLANTTNFDESIPLDDTSAMDNTPTAASLTAGMSIEEPLAQPYEAERKIAAAESGKPKKKHLKKRNESDDNSSDSDFTPSGISKSTTSSQSRKRKASDEDSEYIPEEMDKDPVGVPEDSICARIKQRSDRVKKHKKNNHRSTRSLESAGNSNSSSNSKSSQENEPNSPLYKESDSPQSITGRMIFAGKRTRVGGRFAKEAARIGENDPTITGIFEHLKRQIDSLKERNAELVKENSKLKNLLKNKE